MIKYWLLLVLGIGLPTVTLAQVVVPAVISITPAKQELTLNPSETRLVNLKVTNSLGYAVEISLSVEDLTPDQYSLREYVVVPKTKQILASGQTTSVPIEIKVPAEAYPGTYHGQIAVTTRAVNPASNEPPAKAAISTQLNSLLFIRVPGEIKESGRVSKFGLLGGPLVPLGQSAGFYIAFTNNGNGYLNPYGLIKILTWRGRELGYAVVSPWYVLPGSTRVRDITDLTLPAGVYQAKLALNRGYGDIIDSEQVWFMVYPGWAKYIGFGLLALLILIIGYRIIKV